MPSGVGEARHEPGQERRFGVHSECRHPLRVRLGETVEAAGRERHRRGEGEPGNQYLQVLRGDRHHGVDHGGGGAATPVLAHAATDGP